MKNKQSQLKVVGTVELIIGIIGTVFFSYGVFNLVFTMISAPGTECAQKFVCAAIILFLPAPFFLIGGLGIIEKSFFGITFNKWAKAVSLIVFVFLTVIHLHVFVQYASRNIYERIFVYFGYLLRNVSWYLVLFFAVRWFLQDIYRRDDILAEFSKRSYPKKDTDESIDHFLKKQKEKKEELIRHLEGKHAPDIWGNLFGGYAIFIGSVGSIFFFYGLAKVMYCDMLGEACGLTIHLARAFTIIFLPAPFLFVSGRRILEGAPRALLYTLIASIVCWGLFIVSLCIFPSHAGQICVAALFILMPLTAYLIYSFKKMKTYKSDFDAITKQLQDLEAKVKYIETEEDYPHGP